MILKDQEPMTPEQLARTLLQQAEILRQHAANVSALESRVASYERKYSISSENVHDAIDRGELKESIEVANWIIDHELLKRTRATTER